MNEDSASLPPAAANFTVGIICNLKHSNIPSEDNIGAPEQESAPDLEAEFDEISTVNAIRSVFETHGLGTAVYEADATLPERIMENPCDLAFNIAEGRGGRNREALVPALFELLRIPYSGSDAEALCIALDKAMCKRLAHSCGIATPNYAVLEPGTFSAEGIRALNLHYPVIVKPNAEGSSKGISEACTAADEAELTAVLEKDFRLYGESMLVEEYLPGREFTVALLGNGDALRVFPPMEIRYRKNTQGQYRIYSYEVKKNYGKFIDYACPADIPEEAEEAMCEAAKKLFFALGCRDFCRVDFRMDAAGTPYFIEANPLPGLAPGYSDFPMAAGFCGLSYENTVMSVLKNAADRLGIALPGGDA